MIALMIAAIILFGAFSCFFMCIAKQEKITAIERMAGFEELISVIFPVCGYAYLIAMPLTARRFWQVRRKNKA